MVVNLSGGVPRESTTNEEECEPLLQSSQPDSELLRAVEQPQQVTDAAVCEINVSPVATRIHNDDDLHSGENHECTQDARTQEEEGSDSDDDTAFRDCTAVLPDAVTAVAAENEEIKQASEHDDVCDEVDDVTIAKRTAQEEMRDEEASGVEEVDIKTPPTLKANEAKPSFDVFDPFSEGGDSKKSVLLFDAFCSVLK